MQIRKVIRRHFRRQERLSEQEPTEQQGKKLPPREVMSTLDPSIAPEPPVLSDDALFPIDPIPKH